MPLHFYDEVEGKLYILSAGALRMLEPLSLGAVPAPAAEPKTRQRKWHKANKAGKDLQNEIEGHTARRQHPATAQIEELLISGLGVPAILEKVEVSPPTVYVIKARLKKEGRLAQ